MKASLLNVQYYETHRGTSYHAKLLLDGEKIAIIENKGIGGATSIYCHEDENRQKLNELIKNHFEKIGWDIKGISTHSLEYTFAEHMLDIHEIGEVDKASLDLGFIV